jgi:hypothetical protein
MTITQLPRTCNDPAPEFNVIVTVAFRIDIDHIILAIGDPFLTAYNQDASEPVRSRQPSRMPACPCSLRSCKSTGHGTFRITTLGQWRERRRRCRSQERTANSCEGMARFNESESPELLNSATLSMQTTGRRIPPTGFSGSKRIVQWSKGRRDPRSRRRD